MYEKRAIEIWNIPAIIIIYSSKTTKNNTSLTIASLAVD